MTPQTRPPSSPQTALWPRAVALLLVGGFMFAGPFAHQILDEHTWFLRNWAMYANSDSNICKVAYRGGPNRKTLQRLDRLALLGHERPLAAPKKDRMLRGEWAIRRQGRELCEVLGPGSVVTVHARCGSRSGWRRKRPVGRKVDLCQPPRVHKAGATP